jgi:hypothetical protein
MLSQRKMDRKRILQCDTRQSLRQMVQLIGLAERIHTTVVQ